MNSNKLKTKKALDGKTNFKNIISKVTKTLEGEEKLLYLTITLSILINIVFITYIDIVKKLINSAIDLNFNGVILWISFASIVLLLDIILNRSYIIIKKKFYCRALEKLRVAFFKKINNISLPVLDKYLNGDLIIRFIDDITEIANFISSALVDVVSNIVLIGLFSVYIAYNQWRLIPIIALLVPITVYVLNKKGDLLKKEADKHQKEVSSLNITAKDIIDNMLEIKSFSAEEYFTSKYEKQEEKVVNHEKKRNYYRTIIWGTAIGNYYFIYLFFYAAGGILAYKGYVDFGLLVGLYLLIDRLVDLLMSIPGMFSSFYEVMPKVNRVYEILDLEENEYIEESIVDNENVDTVVKMSGVNYGYGQETKVLKDITLEIKRGERIAIVGESGCGKSTLLQMLIGYDHEYNGTIQIFGKEMNKCPQKSMTKNISYCAQEPFLMSKSIIENFQLFYDSVKEDTLKEYAKMVELHNDIESLEDKYNTVIQDGGKNLSGGQKQRIGLMLSLMKESYMYLIDEGFSALDPAMTERILENIFNYSNETIVVVTHKLYENVMTKFHRIIVMEKGRIVEIGSHHELIQREVYKTLFEKSKLEAGN